MKWRGGKNGTGERRQDVIDRQGWRKSKATGVEGYAKEIR